MAPVIVARDLYKCYTGFAPVLRGASIEVQPGEAVAIMGPSGCGKSTMLHILGMLHTPDAGSLNILDTDVLKLNREETAAFRRGNMGFVMQANNLFEHSTVFENVEFPLIYENVPPQERWARVIRALELVRLSGRVHYRSNRLSGGEQQRVAIARAMVNNPRILLADEPTGALDTHTSRLIMENFRRLCHSGGVSLVMVTHDPQMAEYCDSIYTLEDGILRTKKHENVHFVPDGKENLLDPIPPMCRGVLFANSFPDIQNSGLMALARKLHEQLLLSHIYAIKGDSFTGNPQGYVLPLPVRRVSLSQRLLALLAFFHRAKNSVSLWKLWQQLKTRRGPASLFHQYKSFASGFIASRWGLADHIQFFFAATARRPATVCWVASHLLRVPFAFVVHGQNLDHFNSNWQSKANDATFIICSTNAVKQEFQKLLPQISTQKIHVAPQPLVASPGDEEYSASIPHQPDRPLQILCPGPHISLTGFLMTLNGCLELKKMNVPFHLSVLGSKHFKHAWRLWRSGLGKQVSFTGPLLDDTLEGLYKNSEIFVFFPDDRPGARLDLPWYLACAMAFRNAVVVTDITPGASEVLGKGENCLQLNKPTALELARTVASLGSDAGLREKIGSQAHNSVMAYLNSSAWSLISDLTLAAIGREEQDFSKIQMSQDNK